MLDTLQTAVLVEGRPMLHNWDLLENPVWLHKKHLPAQIQAFLNSSLFLSYTTQRPSLPNTLVGSSLLYIHNDPGRATYHGPQGDGVAERGPNREYPPMSSNSLSLMSLLGVKKYKMT